MKQFDKYRMVDGSTPLAARYFNRVWQDIDLRLASLEEVKIAWQSAVDEVVKFGLARIDELIREPLQSVVALSEQAESAGGRLEQLRQLAESRTTALALLIETLQADTNAQVGSFIETANQRIRLHQEATHEQLALWKAQRTSELDRWVSEFEDALQSARQEIDAQVTRLARHKIEQRVASFTLQAADIATHFDIQTTAVVTLPDASNLGIGWWCYLRNSGEGAVTVQAPAGSQIDGLASYVMYSGECRMLQCVGGDDVFRTTIVTPLRLVMRTSFDFIKPPGYRAFDMDVRGATGGGGGGGSGAISQNYATSGGGGGSGGLGYRWWARFIEAALSSVTPFIVGAPGLGGVGATTPINGSMSSPGFAGEEGKPGGVTTITVFGTTFSINGGLGGKPGLGGGLNSPQNPGSGGLGGTPGTASVTPSGADKRYGYLADGTAAEFSGNPGASGSASATGNPDPAPGGVKGPAKSSVFAAGYSGAGGDGGPALKVFTAPSVAQPGSTGEPGMVMIAGVL